MKSAEQPEVARIEIHYRDGSVDVMEPGPSDVAPLYVVAWGGRRRPSKKSSGTMHPEEVGLTLFGTVVDGRRILDYSRDARLAVMWRCWQDVLRK